MEEVPERFRAIEFHEDFDRIAAFTNGGITQTRELLKEVRSVKTFVMDGTTDYTLFNETGFKCPWIL